MVTDKGGYSVIYKDRIATMMIDVYQQGRIFTPRKSTLCLQSMNSYSRCLPIILSVLITELNLISFVQTSSDFPKKFIKLIKKVHDSLNAILESM